MVAPWWVLGHSRMKQDGSNKLMSLTVVPSKCCVICPLVVAHGGDPCLGSSPFGSKTWNRLVCLENNPWWWMAPRPSRSSLRRQVWCYRLRQFLGGCDLSVFCELLPPFVPHVRHSYGVKKAASVGWSRQPFILLQGFIPPPGCRASAWRVHACFYELPILMAVDSPYFWNFCICFLWT